MKFSSTVDFEKFTTAERDARVAAGKLPVGSVIENTTTGTVQWRKDSSTWVDISSVSAYVYVAYATDTAGTGFSASPAGKTHMAVRTSNTPLVPVVGDFTGLWFKVVGDNGASGAIFPAKRVYLTWQESGSSLWVQRVIDAATMRVTNKLLSHLDASCVTTKNGTSGRVYHCSSQLQAISNALELTNTVLDAQLATTTVVTSVGAVYDSVSDAVYCITNSNQLTKITDSGFTVTRNSTNTISSANAIVVGAGRVFVFTTTNTIYVFDTNLTFIQTTSVGGSFGTFNPDKNRVISVYGSGYIEVHPTTFAQTTANITANAQCIAYGNGKYVIGRTSDIIVVDATTNTIVATLGTGQGVPSASYPSAVFMDGKFWVSGSNMLVVIDATTNAVLKTLAIRPAASSTSRLMLATHDVS